MARDLLYTVNFGTAKTGLSSVGYTLYRTDGTVHSTRTTAGVVEFGSSGVYGAKISRPDEDVLVLWDTGEGTPKFGSEDSRVLIDSIANDSEKVKLIWNSIKNQGEFLADLMDKLGLLEKNQGLATADITKAISKIKIPEISIPEVKIPEFPTIPDYSDALNALKDAVSAGNSQIQAIPSQIPDFSPIIDALNSIRAMISALPQDNSRAEAMIQKVSDAISKIPTTQPEYSGHFDAMQELIADTLSLVSDKADAKDLKDLKSLTGMLLKAQDYFKGIQDVFGKMDDLLGKISKYNESMQNATKQELADSKKSIESDIQKVHQLVRMVAQKDGILFFPDTKEMQMAIGHKL